MTTTSDMTTTFVESSCPSCSSTSCSKLNSNTCLIIFLTCGNGALETSEECDDANNVSGDGCSNCKVDQFYECSRSSNTASTPDVCEIQLYTIVSAFIDTNNNLVIEFDRNPETFKESLTLTTEPTMDFSYSVIQQGDTSLMVETTFNEDIVGVGNEKIIINYIVSPTILNATDYNGTSYSLHKDIDTSSAAYKSAEAAGYFGSGTIIVTIVTSVAASIFFGTSNEAMWIMVNAFQIIYLTLAMKLYFSALVMRMFSMLSFVNMENQFLASLFLFNIDQSKFSDEPLSEAFAEIGYETTAVLLNAAEIFATWEIFIPSFCVIILIRRCMRNASGKCQKKFVSWVDGILQELRYNAVLRTFLELFVDLYVSCVINLYVRNLNSTLEIVSLVIAIILMLVLTYIPLFNAYFILKHRGELEPFKTRFGTLFENFRESSSAALLFQTFFLLRRCAFGCILIFGRNNGYLQCSYFFGSNLLMVAYSLAASPFKSTFLNFSQILSEMVMMFISLAYFQFRQYQSTDNQIYFSFLVIASVCFLGLVNLITIFTSAVKSICKKRKEQQKEQAEIDEINEIYERTREERKMNEALESLKEHNRHSERSKVNWIISLTFSAIRPIGEKRH